MLILRPQNDIDPKDRSSHGILTLAERLEEEDYSEIKVSEAGTAAERHWVNLRTKLTTIKGNIKFKFVSSDQCLRRAKTDAIHFV